MYRDSVRGVFSSKVYTLEDDQNVPNNITENS